MATLKNLLCLLLIAVSGHCSTETLVPFIAWSSGNELTGLSTKQPVTVEEFFRGTELSDIEYFVVFKTSKLSFDDIVKFGGVYGEKHSALSSLQSSLQSAKSTLWTGMHGEVAENLIARLSFNYDLSPQRISDSEDVSLNPDAKQLIVVILPEGDSGERGFMEQDKVISQVMTTVSQSKKPYVAFYTADHSSLDQKPRMKTFVQSKRQAPNTDSLGNDDMDETYNETDVVCGMVNNGSSTANDGRCVMMCLNTPIQMVVLDEKGAIANITDVANSLRFIDGSCIRGNETERCNAEIAPYFEVEAHFNESGPMTFRFIFKQGDYSTSGNCSVSGGFWTIGVEVDGEEFVRNTRSNLFSKFEIPIGVCYACGKNSHNIFTQFNASDPNDTMSYVNGYWFSGIQAQVGGVFTPTSFASAYNCEGYVNHVSLMGVVTVLVILIVLYCSTVFMFQMKSMDRFDDPRGPTITVENLH